MKGCYKGLLILCCGLLPCESFAHARFKLMSKISPRSADSNLKIAPCGNIPIDESKRVSLTGGESITVEWEETINHPGSYKISFAPDETLKFQLLQEIKDVQDTPVTYNNPATYHKYSATITVPKVNCTKCSFQLIQVMTDQNPPTFYYSCSDVKITSSETVTNPATATKTGTSVNTQTSTATSPSESSSASNDQPKNANQGSASTKVEGEKPDAPTNLKVSIRKQDGN